MAVSDYRNSLRTLSGTSDGVAQTMSGADLAQAALLAVSGNNINQTKGTTQMLTELTPTTRSNNSDYL